MGLMLLEKQSGIPFVEMSVFAGGSYKQITMANTPVSANANPDRPASDIPRSIKNHPTNCGFLLHLYMPVVISFEISCPVDLRNERNSSIPIGNIITPIPNKTKPPTMANVLLIGNDHTA